MKSKHRARKAALGSRPAFALADRLRAAIASGRLAPGGSLPAERQLAGANGVAPMTARRALKSLEREGLIAAEPRRGYRVLAGAGGPDRGLPVAYVAQQPETPGRFWDEFHRTLLAEFRRVASLRGWSLLATCTNGRNQAEVVGQVRSAQACGAVIDDLDEELVVLLRREGIPVVLIDYWRAGISVDSVVQDGFTGGVLATRQLVDRGHRRIGWLGPAYVAGDLQVAERFGGAAAALDMAGLGPDPALRAQAPLGNPPEAIRAARRLLDRPDRPTAVLALWQEMTSALAAAARQLGLVPGREFEMVGWANEELYESAYLPLFAGGPVPPAVVWSIAEMAGAAVSALKQRRTEPGAPPRHLRVPTKLRAGCGAPAQEENNP